MIILMQGFVIISCEIPVFPAVNVRTSAGKITACEPTQIKKNITNKRFFIFCLVWFPLKLAISALFVYFIYIFKKTTQTYLEDTILNLLNIEDGRSNEYESKHNEVNKHVLVKTKTNFRGHLGFDNYLVVS